MPHSPAARETDTMGVEAVTAAAGDTVGISRIWENDVKIRNEQDWCVSAAPVLFVLIMKLLRYLFKTPIICSASVEVTVSLGPNLPSVGTRPF